MTAAQLLRVGRYDVELAEYGSGDPLIYLHGFAGAPPAASPFLAALAGSRRVIVPSHPGFGRSTDDVAIHQMHNVVVFYQELFEALSLRQADVVGHSLGGMFAAELAAVAPALVRRLVLAAPLGLWIDEAPVPDFLPSGGNALMRTLWADPSTGTPPPSGTDTPEAAELFAAHTANLSAATNYLWPLPDRGLKHRIHRISSPTLLVWGDSDHVVGAPYRERFQALIRGAKLEVIPSAGHLLTEEQPAAASRAILDFLA